MNKKFIIILVFTVAILTLVTSRVLGGRTAGGAPAGTGTAVVLPLNPGQINDLIRQGLYIPGSNVAPNVLPTLIPALQRLGIDVSGYVGPAAPQLRFPTQEEARTTYAAAMTPTAVPTQAPTVTPTLSKECQRGILITMGQEKGWLPPQKPGEPINHQTAWYIQDGFADGRPLGEMYQQVFGGPECGRMDYGRREYVPRHTVVPMTGTVELSYGIKVSKGELTCQKAAVGGSQVTFGTVQRLDLRTQSEGHEEIVTCVGRRDAASAAVTKIAFLKDGRTNTTARLLEMWYLFGESAVQNLATPTSTRTPTRTPPVSPTGGPTPRR